MHLKERLRSSFLGNTFVNAAGIAAGQFLVLLAMPVLARSYSPAEFGIYASLVALSGVIGTGSALRFDMALPSTHGGETAAMYRLALASTFLSLLAGIFFVVLDGQHILPWPAPLKPSSLALLCVVTGTFQALMGIVSAALVRRGRFAQLALLRFIQPAAFVMLALAAIPGGLLAAYATALVLACLCGLALTWRPMMDPLSSSPGQVLRKYWEYPLVSLPVAMLDTLTLSMPLLFIVQYYGNAAAGNYSQAQRLVAAPLILLSAAIFQVFYKHAGDALRAGQQARPMMWKIVRSLSLAAAVIIILVGLAGQPVLSLFLGEGWRTDSYYLMLVLLPAVFRLCVSPISSIFLLTGQVRLGAMWQVAYAATTWVVLGNFAVRHALDDFLLFVVVNELIMYALYLWMADIAVRRLERKAMPCAV